VQARDNIFRRLDNLMRSRLLESAIICLLLKH
jgi:hypothetical protein